MIFLTYNDLPGGIYNSQVIDVVNYLNQIQKKQKVKLLALISVRGFFNNRKKIKQQLPGSIVIPMMPKIRFWKLNYPTLLLFFLFSKHKKIMARGPFAAAMALKLKKNGLVKKVIFDARGAYEAEFNEYYITPDKKIKSQIALIEKQAVLNSDFRLAVSNALVNYWQKNYNYSDNKHVVIPCTLNRLFNFNFPSEKQISEHKVALGFNADDIIIVYSGSSASWQSFKLIDTLLSDILSKQEKVKVLLLTDKINPESSLLKQFTEKVKTNWLNTNEVPAALMACDYGLLYREKSITNKVASPVKFAEYLACGLNVIISNDLGDYSNFTLKHNCGLTNPENHVFKPISYQNKLNNNTLAKKHFLKHVFEEAYKRISEL